MSGTEYFLSGLVIFIASFVQGLSGFGFALLAVPLLTLIIGVKSAVTLTVICSLFVTLYNFMKLSKYFTIGTIKELIAGSLVGVPLGAYFLRETHAETVEFMLAGIILGFVMLSSFKLVKFKGMSDKWGYVFGLIAGICGGAVSISGPPVLIYSYMKDWEKEKFKGAIAAYFFISGIIILGSHMATGLTTFSTCVLFFVLSPFLFLGAFTGHFFFKGMDTPFFRKIILSILFVLGMSMIVLNI